MAENNSDHDRGAGNSSSQPGDVANARAEVPDAAGSGGHGNYVSVCAWCPELRVLRISRRPGDIVGFITNEEGKLDLCYRKTAGRPVVRLTISHGICPSCQAKLVGGGT